MMGRARNERLHPHIGVELDHVRFQAASFACIIQQSVSHEIGSIADRINIGQVEGVEGTARTPTTIQLLWLNLGIEVRISFSEDMPAQVQAGFTDKLGIVPPLDLQARIETVIRKVMNEMFPHAVKEAVA